MFFEQSAIEQFEKKVMKNAEKSFSQFIAGESTERLLELKGQYQEEFTRFPKSKSIEEAIKQLDAEIRRRPDAPKFVKVRAISEVGCDGKRFKRDETGEITEQQFNALAIHFEKIS